MISVLFFVPLPGFMKNCRLGANRCSHSGCSEAKLIYLHLKTCTAHGNNPCPTNRRGCQDARKLLAHYRRCRELRSRQTSSGLRTQHVCLVCSLVARQARGSLEKSRSSSPKSRKLCKRFIPAISLSTDKPVEAPVQRTNAFPAIPTASMDPSPQNGAFLDMPPPRSEKRNVAIGAQKMPPPPPRSPFSTACTTIQGGSHTRPSKRRAPLGITHEEKSDTQNVTYRPADAHSFDETNPAADIHGEGDVAQSKQGRTFHRPRSESLDDATAHEHTSLGGSKDNSAAGRVRVTAIDNYNDNSVDLTRGEQLEDRPHMKRTPGRRRSQSCSVPSSSGSSRGMFDTILEEPVGEELHRLLDSDS